MTGYNHTSQGSGILNKSANVATSKTGVYIAGGVGLTAAGGAGLLYVGGVAGIASLESLGSACVLWCDKELTAGEKFFENAQCSDKVIQQMNNASDAYHSFPELVTKQIQQVGSVTTEFGGDGNVYTFLRAPGSVNGQSGFYTFIKDTMGIINHRFFEF